MKKNTFLNEQKGAVAIILAFLMAALAGFSALALDLGGVYLEKYALTNIVDSAALAGAQEIPADFFEAKQKAEEYALLNGAKNEELTITTDSDSNTITVLAERTVSFYFAKILGFARTQITARAVAGVGTLGKVNGIVPFGIQEQQLEFGKLYDLKVSAPPTLGAGNFGALALGGNGSNRFRDNIKYGYQEWVEIGDVLPTESGNMSGPTMQGVNYRISEENHFPCTPDNFRRDCPRLVTVPVYEPIGDENHIKEVRIKGFAAFLLDEVSGQGNESYIKGYFVQTIVPGISDQTAGNYGLQAVKLSQ